MSIRGISRIVSIMLAGVTCAAAVVVYDESGPEGDFSDDYLNPTSVILGVGENLISGSVRGNPLDRDLFTLMVPEGMSLGAIHIINFSGALEALSFMGAQPGEVLSDSPERFIQAGQDPTISVGPINYVLFGAADAATDRDVMPQLIVGAPMNGQTPLPAGKYAFWINETRALTSYTINFEVIPEPSASALLILGLVFGLGHRVRR